MNEAVRASAGSSRSMIDPYRSGVARNGQAPYEWRWSWSWTNWTVGIWWDRRKLHAAGIDLGPLELVRRRRRVMAVRRG